MPVSAELQRTFPHLPPHPSLRHVRTFRLHFAKIVGITPKINYDSSPIVISALPLLKQLPASRLPCRARFKLTRGGLGKLPTPPARLKSTTRIILYYLPKQKQQIIHSKQQQKLFSLTSLALTVSPWDFSASRVSCVRLQHKHSN